MPSKLNPEIAVLMDVGDSDDSSSSACDEQTTIKAVPDSSIPLSSKDSTNDENHGSERKTPYHHVDKYDVSNASNRRETGASGGHDDDSDIPNSTPQKAWIVILSLSLLLAISKRLAFFNLHHP